MFCVFDRNGHANFDAALEHVRQSHLGQEGRLAAITSWPCFEIWMLLHFRYDTAAIVPAGGRSAGEVARRELTEHMPGYTKGRKDTYSDLLPRREKGLTDARRLQKEKECTS